MPRQPFRRAGTPCMMLAIAFSATTRQPRWPSLTLPYIIWPPRVRRGAAVRELGARMMDDFMIYPQFPRANAYGFMPPLPLSSAEREQSARHAAISQAFEALTFHQRSCAHGIMPIMTTAIFDKDNIFTSPAREAYLHIQRRLDCL